MQDMTEQMIEKYGPLLTNREAAKILSRSPEGFRVSMYRNLPLYNELRKIKRRIGKNNYYPTYQFFDVILNFDSSAK